MNGAALSSAGIDSTGNATRIERVKARNDLRGYKIVAYPVVSRHALMTQAKNSENKISFVVAVQTTNEGQPVLANSNRRPFTKEAVRYGQ